MADPIPCVILASYPKADAPAADVTWLKETFGGFGGVMDEKVAHANYTITRLAASANDGGNGGGGEPGGASTKWVLGAHGRTFWNFRELPNKAEPNRDIKFPAPMRWEFCYERADIGDAMDYINSSDGQRLIRLFTFVQIVAKTQHK